MKCRARAVPAWIRGAAGRMPAGGDKVAAEVWAEIDLSAIACNVRAIRSLLQPSSRLMAVVKANAYGHGLLPVARHAVAAGADWLGVARLEEAMKLRQGGISAPILIFGYTPPEAAGVLVSHNLAQTVYSIEIARRTAEEARKSGGRLAAHIKVDTGMGRLGIVSAGAAPADGMAEAADGAFNEIEAICRLRGLRVEGVYTHFATADHADKSFAHRQFAAFQGVLDALCSRGISAGLIHAANSAALIDMPETRLDMVRPGISIYGLYPSAAVSRSRIALQPAMTLKSRIIHLKSVDAGFYVSYGATARTSRPTRLATVAVGYGDGYNRALSSKGRMRVRGQYAPVVGRVCMDQTVLDVGHIPGVEVGDEVVVFGRDSAGELPVAELAAKLDTISYEVVTGISERVERVYAGQAE